MYTDLKGDLRPLAKQVDCLAEAMFFEARGEGSAGMRAVGRNILKRLSINYRGANTVCDVVYTPRQYSYLWDKVPDVVKPEEVSIFCTAVTMAERMIVEYSTNTLPEYHVGTCEGGATHYHTTKISPSWSKTMRETCGVIGNHIFYNGA